MPKQPRRGGSAGSWHPRGDRESRRLRLAQTDTWPRGEDPALVPSHVHAPRRPGAERGADSEILAAFEAVSRKMEDLARELDCFGFFDDGDDDRPRAA